MRPIAILRATAFCLAAGAFAPPLAPTALAQEGPTLGAAPLGREGAVDLVQVENGRLYHFGSGAALVVYDVSDPGRPRRLGQHVVAGTPSGVVVANGIALLVTNAGFVRSESESGPGPTAVVAVDLRDAAHPRPLGESHLDGALRGVRVNGSTLFVATESLETEEVSVSAFRRDGSDVSSPETSTRHGSAPAVRAVADRVVLAYRNPGLAGTRVEVLGEGALGALETRGWLDLAMLVGRESREASARIDAADPAHVRVIGCRTALCVAGDPLDVATVDITRPVPRLVSTRAVRAPGTWLTTRFDGGRLYLSRIGWVTDGSTSTTVSVVDLDAAATRPAGLVTLPGTVWNVVPTGGAVLAVTSRTDAGVTRDEVALEALEASPDDRRGFTRSAVVADGWSSSEAQRSSGGMAMCGARLGVAFHTYSSDFTEPRDGVAVFEWNPSRGFGGRTEVPVPGRVERLLCVRETLLAAGDTGVWPVRAE